MRYFKEKSASGTTLLTSDTLLIEKRNLFIEGEINSESALKFMKDMMCLIEQDNHKPIHVFINSCGGNVNSGLLIYDIIVNCPVEVNLYCIECAFSMAAVLLACGKKGHRYIFEHSEVMLHEPLLPNGGGGSCSSLRSISNRLMEKKDLILDLLVKHTNKDYAILEKEIAYDHYFSAQEALAFGLCDKIIHFNELFEEES